jgi:hypothetical protein
MEQSIISYTAGLLDGEGSIQINPSKSASGKCYWNLTVQISSGCRKVLDELHGCWNFGNVKSYQPKGKRSYRRSCYWRMYSKQAEEFLREILPHLRIKREHAELALEFRRYVGYRRGQLTEEISSKRNEIALKMRELNQLYGKGPLKPLRKEVL